MQGAAKAGLIPEVQIGDAVIRFVPSPSVGSKVNPDYPNTFETFEEYEEWRDRQQAKNGSEGCL
jgi:hypothetical protein